MVAEKVKEAIWTEYKIQEVINQIVSIRDFCGNEYEAFKDFCQEEGLPITSRIESRVFRGVNFKWKEFQKKAGVSRKYFR